MGLIAIPLLFLRWDQVEAVLKGTPWSRIKEFDRTVTNHANIFSWMLVSVTFASVGFWKSHLLPRTQCLLLENGTFPGLCPHKLHQKIAIKTQMWSCFVHRKSLIKYKIHLLLLEPSGNCLDLQIDRISQHLLDLHKKQLLCLGIFFKPLTLGRLQVFSPYLPTTSDFSSLFSQRLSNNRN